MSANLTSAVPVTDKRLLEIKQAQVDDTTCQNIQEFSMRGWPDKREKPELSRLYPLTGQDVHGKLYAQIYLS